MKVNATIPTTLLLAIILLAGFGFLFPKNGEKYLAESFWAHKTHLSSQSNVVLLGDSRVYRGVSPQVMQRHLPHFKILNFGYSNGGLNPTMFRAAEKKLVHKGQPRIIVLGISANTLTAYTQNNDQYLQELNRPREEVIERLYFSPVKYWFSPVSPESLKAWLIEAPPTAYYKNEYQSNGYVRSEKFPADTMEAIPSYVKDFTHFKVSDEKLQTLCNQTRDWTGNGIQVVGFRPPVSHSMRLLEDTLGFYNENEIKARFAEAGGLWFELNPTRFQTYDGSHLTESSAIKLSEQLGAFLSQLQSKAEP